MLNCGKILSYGRQNKTDILMGGKYYMLKDLVSRIKEKYLNWKYRNEYTDILNDYDFIWGVKSYDDLSESECNLYTMNDIDITYNKK